MTNDPIADLLTRIRNGLQRRKAHVDVPASKVLKGILRVMRAEGYVLDVDEIEDRKQGLLRVRLKYGPDGEAVITELRRVSKPSRRVYKRADDVEPVLGGLGVGIYSTPQGIIGDRQARRLRVGGEWLCSVW
jgi:small subunit ribosomal protein S8